MAYLKHYILSARGFVTAVAVTILLLIIPMGELAAQNPERYVQIALVDELDDPDARALVVLRGSGRPFDLIVVVEETTPADLSRAATVVIRARRSGLSPPQGRPAAELRTFIYPSSGTAVRNLQQATLELERLLSAPERSLADFGIVRTVLSPIASPSP